MSKKEIRSSLMSHIRILFSVLLIAFALGSSACSNSGGSSDSSSVTGSAQ